MKQLVLALLVVASAAAPAHAIQPQNIAQLPPTTTAGDPKAVCTQALQQDSQFAAWVLEKGYEVQSARCMDLDAVAAKRRLELDQNQHETAAAAISKNERHVVMAYIAMWLCAVGFIVFLWMRQQKLTAEIQSLRSQLDAAVKDE